MSQIEIAAVDFLKIIYHEENHNIENYKVIGKLDIKSINKTLTLTFSNCEFQDIFLSLFSSDEVNFKNCILDGDLIFDDALKLKKLFIANCAIKGTIEDYPNKKPKSIDELYIDNLEVDRVILRQIVFWDVTIGNSTKIKRLSLANPSSSQRSRSVIIDIVKLGNCEINIEGDFQSLSANYLQKCRLTISSEVEVPVININACKESKVSLMNLSCKGVLINECDLKGLLLSDIKIENLETSITTLKSLVIRGKIEGTLIIGFEPGDKVRIIENFLMTFGAIAETSKIIINQVQSISISVRQFINYGHFQINNSKIENEFILDNANLGKTHFNNVQLEKRCKVKIYDSHLTDTIFSNINLAQIPFDEEINRERFQTNIDSYECIRETYRQLKSAYVAQGKKIESLEFQKRELVMHYNTLKETRYHSFANLGNFLIIGSNKLASDFGQNIWKPLIGLLSIHLILYNIFLYVNDYGYFSPLCFTWSYTWKMSSLYFFTLLPTHPFLIDGKNIGGLWDTLMRIFSGYFIFYFITASRKFHQ